MPTNRLPEYIEDDSTTHLASLLHFIIYEAGNTQVFHRLRLWVKDLSKFSEIIALAMKDYQRLKGDERLKEATDFTPPSESDIKASQRFFAIYGKEYLQVLLARASALRKCCRKEVR